MLAAGRPGGGLPWCGNSVPGKACNSSRDINRCDRLRPRRCFLHRFDTCRNQCAWKALDNFRALAAGRSRKRWIVHDAMVAARRFRSLSFEAKEPLPEVRRKEHYRETNASSMRKRDDSLFAGQRSIDHSVRAVPVSFEHACQPVNRAASRRASLCGHILQMPEKRGLGASVC